MFRLIDALHFVGKYDIQFTVEFLTTKMNYFLTAAFCSLYRIETENT